MILLQIKPNGPKSASVPYVQPKWAPFDGLVGADGDLEALLDMLTVKWGLPRRRSLLRSSHCGSIVLSSTTSPTSTALTSS